MTVASYLEQGRLQHDPLIELGTVDFASTRSRPRSMTGTIPGSSSTSVHDPSAADKSSSSSSSGTTSGGGLKSKLHHIGEKVAIQAGAARSILHRPKLTSRLAACSCSTHASRGAVQLSIARAASMMRLTCD